MRCHYEVLDVARDAEASAIRKAYHRAALQHHPDKSTAADAEERFREVQAAYEILSVPAERAWYDGHRDSILRDDDGGNGAGTAPDDEFSLFAFFRTSAYSGFGSGSGSFYGVYGDVFARLSSQEARAAAAAGRAYSPPPPMGGPDTPYAPSVASFYDAWLSFATLKDFSWCDEHNPAQAPGRKIRRLMEEENRRARRAAAREHSDGVRQLAAFCRARDPRVREHARAAEAEAARRTAEAAARRAAEKAAKAAKVAAFREAEWLAGEGEAEPQWMQDELDALAAARDGAGGGAGGDGEGGEGLYCAVCSKRFRTEAQWANHERSRKHIDALALLRAQLEDEERRAGGEAGGSDGDEAAAGGSAAESSDDEAAGRGAKGGTRAARKKAAKAAKRMGRAQARAAPGDSDSDGEEAGDYDAGSLAAELASKARVASPEEKAAASGDDSDGGDEADLLRFAARTRRAAPEDAASGGDSGSGSESDESDADTADAAQPEAPVEAPAAAAVTAAGKKARRANKGSKAPAAEDAPAAPPRPLGKRGLKAAARRAGGGSAKAAPQPAIPETGTACALCGAEHESRSALFRHLRAAHSLRS